MLFSLPGMFSPGLCFTFEKKRMQKTQFFLAVSFGDLLLNKKERKLLFLTKDLQKLLPGKTEIFAYIFS